MKYAVEHVVHSNDWGACVDYEGDFVLHVFVQMVLTLSSICKAWETGIHSINERDSGGGAPDNAEEASTQC